MRWHVVELVVVTNAGNFPPWIYITKYHTIQTHVAVQMHQVTIPKMHQRFRLQRNASTLQASYLLQMGHMPPCAGCSLSVKIAVVTPIESEMRGEVAEFLSGRSSDANGAEI